MFDFLRRRRLRQRGLASKKTRRRRTRNELLHSLEYAAFVKIVILAAFIGGLAFLIFSSSQPEPTKSFVIALLFFATAVAALWINHPKTFAQNSRVFLVFGTVFLQLAAIRLVLVFFSQQHSFKFLTPEMGWLLAPYAFAPLVLSVLLGRNHGLYAAFFVSFWSSVLFTNVDAPLLVISLITGFTAVYLTLQVRSRGKLIRAGVGVGIAIWLSSLSFGLIKLNLNPPTDNDWGMIGLQSALALGNGIVYAMLVGGALPLLEHLFQITTDVSWLELSDLNHPLLRRMTMEAPGTYHHSLVVANLAEAAAEKIGANATMCRVCAYFHDVGKLVKPQYFTENMSFERNPHDDLAPSMSALIIIAHVKEGVDLALKYKLNQHIIDIIQQHHGTSLVYYFYQRALQQQEDARAGGKIMNIREEDIPEVEEESFRYPGPKPQTKESAIVSLADIVESASRSLEKPTPQKVEQLVNELIEERIADGQLDECDLTLGELRKIAERFRFTLMTMLHTRIAYPKGESKFTPVSEEERLRMRPDVMASLRKPDSAPPVSAA
jgi:putative nucleotidyltransferase with HDIG domain